MDVFGNGGPKHCGGGVIKERYCSPKVKHPLVADTGHNGEVDNGRHSVCKQSKDKMKASCKWEREMRVGYCVDKMRLSCAGNGSFLC